MKGQRDARRLVQMECYRKQKSVRTLTMLCKTYATNVTSDALSTVQAVLLGFVVLVNLGTLLIRREINVRQLVGTSWLCQKKSAMMEIARPLMDALTARLSASPVVWNAAVGAVINATLAGP